MPPQHNRQRRATAEKVRSFSRTQQGLPQPTDDDPRNAGRDLIEIRLLGTFRVRRADGTLVDAREWRTSKTRELVRLLALRTEAITPVDQLLDALWPGADVERARARLRTAASQVRRVLGPETIVREAGGMRLQGVWVDVQAYSTLVATAKRRFADQQLAEGLKTMREALALYAGDLCADEPYADWSLRERERLHALHRSALADAAEVALTLGWPRDALDLAVMAIEADPCAERGYRALMRAHAQLGETGAALRAYQRLRETLTEQLGADPSPETEALHVNLLSVKPTPRPRPPLVAREAQLATLHEAIRHASAHHKVTGVLVNGPRGAGKTRLVEECCEARTEEVLRLPAVPALRTEPLGLLTQLVRLVVSDHTVEPTTVDQVATALQPSQPLILFLDDIHWADPASIDALAALLERVEAPVTLMATQDPAPSPPAGRVEPHLLPGVAEISLVDLAPLSLSETQYLLEAALGEPPVPALANQLHAASGGWPGELLARGRALLESGQLVWSRDGLATAPRDFSPASPPPSHHLLARARDALSTTGLYVLEVASVVDEPFDLACLEEILSHHSRPQILGALDVLEDLTILHSGGQVYRFRDPLLRNAAYYWVRPSVRRRIEHLVRERTTAAPPAPHHGPVSSLAPVAEREG